MNGRLRASVRDRLARAVVKDEESGCWLWLGRRGNVWRGRIAVNGERRYAHSVSYEEFVGVIPDGMVVSHECSNYACINPEHLSLRRCQRHPLSEESPGDRIRAKVSIDKRTDCWNWTGATANGYGVLNFGGQVRAHRLAYETFVGPIPDGLLVCHRCDNPRCVNPGHLFVGTNSDNTRDMVSKGRQRNQITKSQTANSPHHGQENESP